jgi:molecular chaperone GrpE
MQKWIAMSKEKTGEKNTKTNNKEQKQKKAETAVEEKELMDNDEPQTEVAEDDIKSEEEGALEKLQDELSEAKDKYLRLYSEYDNYRRRTAKEKLEMIQTANENLMVTLLPILDDFERAEGSLTDLEETKAVKEGLTLISQKFIGLLQQKGLKQMDTSVGADFDADLHEAITQIPAPKPKLKGKIVDTVEKGYYLGEKVIRHARVVIGN